MGTKKLSAIGHILCPRRSLVGKMKLVLFIDQFHKDLVEDMEASATKAGKLSTLQALKAITDEKLDGR
jgi:hypothetical protein